MTDSSSQAPSSGVSHVDALPTGTRLAEFEILSLLGVGGFGMVYKAFDHSLHRPVAIKEYMPSALAGRAQGQSLWVRSSSDQQTFQTGLSSFVDEARLLAQFDHPSLVKVFRFWEANNTAYMVMPLYSGMTFKQARAQMRTPPPEIWLRKLLWTVLGALRVLHDGKTLHRDISPDNIFLQDNGPPVLLDLGAARHAINDQDRKHTAVLKVNYAPIEQYADGDDDLRQGPWSDLYSLAAVVHGCLCNDTPLPATLRSIRDRMVSFPRVAKTVKRQFGVEYSEPFVAAIAQSLALRPADRPQSIDAFLAAMEMTSPPEGVQHFDFRAELGDIWVEPADQPGPGLLTPTVDVTSGEKLAAAMQAHVQRAAAQEATVDSTASGPDTVAIDAEDTVFIDAGDTVAAEDSRHDLPAPARREPAGERPGNAAHRKAAAGVPQAGRPVRPRRRSPLVWVAAGALVVVAAATGVRWAQNGPAPKDDIITEMAEPAAVAASATEVASEAAAAASAPAVVPAPSASVAAAVAEVPAVAASAPKPPPRTTPKRVAAEPPPPPPVMVKEEPVAEPPPVVAAPRPRPAPARQPTPQEVCADSSFLARPMCIHQECQKPAQANQQVCVENRRRYEAEELRRRQTPN
ncbi:serine/threonine protein kinase [Paracidovorax sp. MALMAid1276]|uniref:serine/threonine protein kinase n=1 Tax=Paracidovorax sp. MALMAid1276 TaxID=3411631 RepID=UPI003B9A2D8F